LPIDDCRPQLTIADWKILPGTYFKTRAPYGWRIRADVFLSACMRPSAARRINRQSTVVNRQSKISGGAYVPTFSGGMYVPLTGQARQSSIDNRQSTIVHPKGK